MLVEVDGLQDALADLFFPLPALGATRTDFKLATTNAGWAEAHRLRLESSRRWGPLPGSRIFGFQQPDIEIQDTEYHHPLLWLFASGNPTVWMGWLGVYVEHLDHWEETKQLAFSCILVLKQFSNKVYGENKVTIAPQVRSLCWKSK